MRFFRKCAALLLTAALTLLPACGSKPAPSQSSGSAPGIQVAMGRYIEEEVAFPQGLESMPVIRRLKDGSIRMLVSKTKDMIVGPWYLYNSKDDGATWSQEDAPWLAKLDQATISAADFTPDGGLVLGYVVYTDEMHAAMEAAMAAMDYEAAMAIQPVYQYAAIDPQGVYTEFALALPDSTDGRAGTPADLRVAENGDLIVSDYYSLYQFDGATYQQKNKFQPTNQPREFLPCGDSLAIVDNGEIQLYDLASGEKTDTVTLPGGDAGGQLAWDSQALYYCGSTGIYRRAAGGTVMEQVVDGALTSLNMPALYCHSFFPSPDKSFLALFGGEQYSVLRYRYSEDTPTVPETQLRVYSLRDNENIRQAMGLYQRRHPGTQVVFDVGIPPDGSISVSDALRTLSTQLLAGQGPDVLVLDGMPVDSYIEKKVLAELPDTLTQGLLPNIVEASKEKDGKLYAMPARFLVPMGMTGSKAAAAMTSLTALADYQSAQTKAMPVVPPELGNPMHPIPSMLINTFYPLCAPTWEKADGTLDNDAIAAFLADIKKISDSIPKEEWQNVPPAAAIDGSSYDLAFAAAYWLYGHIPMVYGHSFEFFNVAPLEEAISQKGDGKVFLLPGQTSGVFLPTSMLGVNAASKAPDAAVEFIKTVLSQEVQLCQFKGYAVNTAAFDQSAVNPFPATDDGYTYGTVEADGSYRYLQVIWPDVPYMEEIKTMLRGLNQSSRSDVIAQQMLLDETRDYFLGTKTLENTMDSLSEKLRLYLSE